MDTFVVMNGIFSIIFVIITSLVGLRIALTYRKYKQKAHLYMGLLWIAIASSWWPSSVSIMVYIFSGKLLPIEIHLSLIFFTSSMWIFGTAGLTEMFYKNKQLIIMIVVVIFCIIIEILLFATILSGNSSQLLRIIGPGDSEWLGWLRWFLIITILYIVIIGIIIAKGSYSADEPEIRLKGLFVLIAILILAVGTSLDGFLELSITTLIIVRLITILSSLFFYIGFILPNWIRNIFIKEK